MKIIMINSGDAGTDEVLANSVRNSQIAQGKGALIVRAGDDAEPRHLLEKIIVAEALPEDGTPVDAATLPWKDDPVVILTGGEINILQTFELLVPGFNAVFGEPTGISG